MKDRSALILYGTETGNAQDVAEEVARMVQRLHFASLISALDDVDPSTLSAYTVVLVAISTTGQGELPNNSRLFWGKLLRKKLPLTYLADVDFGLFGLGDSSYPKFNWAALKLYRRMLQLGARAITPKGDGDEQHPEGIDSIFIPWVQSLRSRLQELFPPDDGRVPISDDVLLQPQWLLGKQDSIEAVEKPLSHTPSSNKAKNLLPTSTNLSVSLVSNDRVTAANHWQDVRHLSFKAEVAADYAPGDILTIFPKNTQDDVDHIISLMEWQDIADLAIDFAVNAQYPTKVITCRPALSAPNESNILTLRSLLTSHLDLNAIPRRSFFALILHFTHDELQKNRLQEFANTEYTDELFDYTTRPRRSTLEVLQEFDTVKIPWQWAATILPILRGRQFSIASGGKLKTNDDGMAQFELLVAIVKYKTVIRKIRRGVCTRYLEDLPIDSRLQVTLVKGSLGISKTEALRPVVMIGPGTGVAPMRSLIWERYAWKQLSRTPLQGSSNSAPDMAAAHGKSLLFFGCRSKDADYFFQDEWRSLEEKDHLKVFAAFSRDQQQKVYVQDLIRERRDLIFHLLYTERGIVYICGSSGKMPQAVRESLIDAFHHGIGADRESAEAYLKVMEKESRYKQETW